MARWVMFCASSDECLRTIQANVTDTSAIVAFGKILLDPRPEAFTMWVGVLCAGCVAFNSINTQDFFSHPPS